MSRMRQRFLVLPRVRSNSLSTLTAQTPTSTSRPVLTTPPRLPSEAPKQSQHSQLALTQPTPALQPPLTNSAPYSAPLSPALVHVPAHAHPTHAPSSGADAPRAHKRQRLKYQLDVGAYGIPKQRPHSRSYHSSASSSPPSSNSYPHTALSVQVGEDAYFVTDSAMGIADGVGGWSRSLPPNPAHPTPSALFSRRLMHFCAAELQSLDAAPPSTHEDDEPPFRPDPSARPPSTHFSFTHHLKPRTGLTHTHTHTTLPTAPPASSHPFSLSDLQHSLDSSLEELSEGIDILNILERAYDSTVKAHHLPPSPPASTQTPTSTPEVVPLTTGSSTALLAVLDHAPPPSSSRPLPQHPPAPEKNYARGSTYTDPALSPHPTPSKPSPPEVPAQAQASAPIATQETQQEDATHPHTQPTYDAVVRIAHLGDCMGMLIRDDTIAWRSDEMWWGYNHPLQLGPPKPSPPSAQPASKKASPQVATPTNSSSPSSSTNPSTTTPPTHTHMHPLPTHPHTFTLPVRTDDILILASDGLSDNLWDEDVLDEVLKFRRAFGGSSSSSFASSSAGPSSSTSPSGSTPSAHAHAQAHNTSTLRRRAFAGMLAEALCSRAKRVSALRGPPPPASPPPPPPSASLSTSATQSKTKLRTRFSTNAGVGVGVGVGVIPEETETECTEGKERERNKDRDRESEGNEGDKAYDDEVPFARRARLAGRSFRGGKADDISVIVALISPSPSPSPSAPHSSSSSASTFTSASSASTHTTPRAAAIHKL